MPLPRIPNPHGPVVIPAVAERAYPDLFITQFSAVAIPGVDSLNVKTRPYNYDTGEIMPDTKEEDHYEPGLYALARVYPAVAQAIGAVTVVSTLLIALRAAEAKLGTLQAALDGEKWARNDKQRVVNDAQSTLTAATTAQALLPAEATDEAKEQCQKALDDAKLAVQTATEELATAEAAATTAQGPRDAQAAIVAGIETQLGKV